MNGSWLNPIRGVTTPHSSNQAAQNGAERSLGGLQPLTITQFTGSRLWAIASPLEPQAQKPVASLEHVPHNTATTMSGRPLSTYAGAY